MKGNLPNTFLLLLLALTLCSGCANLPTSPSADGGQSATWQQDMRALGGHGSFLGVSNEAREIESNLGFN